MRILIDLDDDTIKALSHLALDANMDRKNYIQSVLVSHAGGSFKAKKPSTARKSKKITPNQIRTGNSFQYFIGEYGCKWDITKLDWQDIKWCADENENFNKVHKPIPLTDDWLLKFGFKKEDKTPSKEHGQYFSIWILDYKYSFAYAPFREDCGIKYVHQLENLYFALTGTELELEDSETPSCRK